MGVRSGRTKIENQKFYFSEQQKAEHKKRKMPTLGVELEPGKLIEITEWIPGGGASEFKDAVLVAEAVASEADLWDKVKPMIK